MKIVKRSLWIVLIGLILSSLYLHLKQDTHVATLTITGVTSEEEVEWKNPSRPLEKAHLKTYEVFFSFPKETPLRVFFWGDLIGVRYKYLEFRPFFHWMGWSDFIEVEALWCDYLDLEQKAKFPSKLFPLQQKQGSGFAKIYLSFWKKLFSKSSQNFFIQRATLKTEYFPLQGPNRSFLLSYKEGKLVSD